MPPSPLSIFKNFAKKDSVLENKVCLHCGKIFASKALLERHTVTHTGQKDWICNYCNLAFNRKDNLRRHVMCVHISKDV